MKTEGITLVQPCFNLIPLLALGACATTTVPDGTSEREMARLNTECQARGGALAPAGNRSGRSESGFICMNAEAIRILH